MKKITLITILIAIFATKSFAHCPIPQWCPSAPLHQILCPGDTIDPIEFPSVIAKTLVITWWMNETRTNFRPTPPPGITVSGDASTPLGDREYAWPVSIKGTPTAPGTHHYTVSNTCGVELLHGSITLAGPPTIGTVTPTGDRSTPQNTAFNPPLTISPATTGTPTPTIQWYSNTTATNNGGTSMGSANGAQTNTFTPPSDVVNTVGVFYYAVATNSCGTAVTTNTSGRHIVASRGCDFVTPERNRVTITSGGPVTTQVWTIPARAGVAAQTWSDFVVSPQCSNRTDYNGGTDPNFNVDCRYNSTLITFPGHYFSWCAVMKYADIFCPGDWRVPTQQDFINLDILMGGTGAANARDPSTAINGQSYTSGSNTDNTASTHNPQGGTWGGSRFTAHATNLTGASSAYWGQELSSSHAAYLRMGDINPIVINPLTSNPKDWGFPLRCVRDN